MYKYQLFLFYYFYLFLLLAWSWFLFACLFPSFTDFFHAWTDLQSRDWILT